jgi:hypothetical protein
LGRVVDMGTILLAVWVDGARTSANKSNEHLCVSVSVQLKR